MTEDEFPIVAAAVRSGINDAYRLGLGVAIQTLEEYRTRTTDPYTLEAVLAHLRELSVRIGQEVALRADRLVQPLQQVVDGRHQRGHLLRHVALADGAQVVALALADALLVDKLQAAVELADAQGLTSERDKALAAWRKAVRGSA